MRRIAVVVLVAVLALALGGCEEMKAKVEAAEKPAPAGEYRDVEDFKVTRVNERSNYEWEIDGVAHDAIADGATVYSVDWQIVDYDDFTDAENNWGSYEGDNEFDDDTIDMLIDPAGVITDINVNIGD